MLDLIIVFFLVRHVGKLAVRKGLKPSTWKIYTVIAWFGGEILGLFLGVGIFGTNNLFGIVSMAIFVAFGGYLLIKYNLDKMPDYYNNDDINNIGSDDLQP